MLKLVVSNDVGSFERAGGITRFRAGDVLANSESRVLVVACGADCTTGMLMPLPDGELREAHIDDMAGWKLVYLSGPRFVEVRRKSSNKMVWCSYLPDIEAAIALWQKLEWAEPSDFTVKIQTQHASETQMLAEVGYFDKPQAERR